ncbi:transposase [Paraburkholderia sp. RL17-373-BIF-A]|uniref:transposase n=1 Tax=Paraburkholderia sp. RL17-373-BIF-A TaxID=3031629 RepID=UPI0038B7F4CC
MSDGFEVDPPKRTPILLKGGAEMGKTRTPHPAAFRAYMVELVKAGCAQGDCDAGVRHDGLITAEGQELTRMRRENRQSKMERDDLSQAAAWFARETGSRAAEVRIH